MCWKQLHLNAEIDHCQIIRLTRLAMKKISSLQLSKMIFFLVTPQLTVNGHRVDLREAVKKTFLEDFAR